LIRAKNLEARRAESLPDAWDTSALGKPEKTRQLVKTLRAAVVPKETDNDQGTDAI
jgi:hypothetical protein